MNTTVRRALLLLASLVLAEMALAASIYHEASCPSVDATRMTRLKRQIAVAQGLLPAPDCHPLPATTVRYLGVLPMGEGRASSSGDNAGARRVEVGSYQRDDGTRVREHTRAHPQRRP